MIKESVFLFLSLLISLRSINAVYVTATHFQKQIINPDGHDEPIDIFILADVSVDPSVDKEDVCKIDRKQNKQMMETLKQGAISKNNSAVVVDASLSEAMRASMHFKLYKSSLEDVKSIKKVKIGVHTSQALLGLRHRGKWGSIAYIYSDISYDTFLHVIRTFEVLEKALGCCKFKKLAEAPSLFPELPDPDQDAKKNMVLARFGSLIKRQLKDFVPNATVGQLKQEIKKLAEMNFPVNILEKDKDNLFIEKARDFLAAYCSSDDEQKKQKIEAREVRDFIWKIFKKKPLSELQDAVYWIYSLQRYCALRGIEIKLGEVLKNFKTIIVSCNYNKIITFEEYLTGKEFIIQKRYEFKEIANPVIFSNFLDKYREKVPPNPDMHRCVGCYAVEAENNKFKEFEELLGSWFCSKCLESKNIV